MEQQEIYIKLSDLEKLTRSKHDMNRNLMVVDPQGGYITRNSIYWVDHYTIINNILIKK